MARRKARIVERTGIFVTVQSDPIKSSDPDAREALQEAAESMATETRLREAQDFAERVLRAHGITAPGRWWEHLGATEPAVRDAANVLHMVKAVRDWIEKGDASQAAWAAMNLGGDLMRLGVRPYEPAAVMGATRQKVSKVNAENTAKLRRERAKEHWTGQYLARAHAELSAEGRKRIGRDALRQRARRLAGVDDVPDAQRDEITSYRAHEFIKSVTR